MTIHKLQSPNQTPTSGVVFWWSNILRSYQLRVYTPQGELAALNQIHPDRASIELAARTLATAMDLELFEIEIEQLDLPSQVPLPSENLRINQK